MTENTKSPDSLRDISIERGVNAYAEGSAIIQQGNTRVLCTASVEKKVPEFLRESGKGWITAEYAMLPRSTHTRVSRKESSRSIEIKRLIGRCLRSSLKLNKIPGYTITIDCDVLQADGGTRCASITGGMVALYDALRFIQAESDLKFPAVSLVAAISVGIVDGKPILDLCYEDDCRADVDMNFAMNQDGLFVEVQGTAEANPFSNEQFDCMKSLATSGIESLVATQKKVLEI